MNEKNSAKAGELSGKEAAPGGEADAVNAAEEAADRAEARADTTPADQAEKGADEVGPNSGGSEPTRDQADPADQADRADKTLVAMPPVSRQDSAQPTADAVSEPDEGQADAATGGSEAAGEPHEDGAASSTPPSDEQPEQREQREEREEQPGEEGKQQPEADAPKSPEAPAKPDPVTAPASVGGPDANPESAPDPQPTPDPDPDPARKPPTPSWAARRESDSERTSEFVALKPDLPRPTSPRPVTPTPGPSSSGEKPGAGSGDSDRTREFTAPSRADNDRTMALTRPPAPSAAAPATSSGTGDAAGPPPPLDLLAQLTNTPPKAETVGRTVARRIKILGTLVALLAVVLVAVQALRPLPTPTLKLTGKSSHTADGGALSLPWPTEGQAVVDIDGLGRMGSYGEMKPLPIGSVAKVMTAYLILRDHPLKAGDKGPSMPVDQKAVDDYTNGVAQKESVVEVKAGQQISELEALQAVMLPSANNVARLLARWDASTEEAFIKKMNDTAKELGMTNTTYTDASGLIESTVSTAEDQVKLAKRAMTNPVFRQIAKLPSYQSTTTSGGNTLETARTQYNFNKLVPLNGVVGIKTGSTTKAGGNLVFAAETTVGDSKQLIIGAVFGQHKTPIITTATAASKGLILAADKALRSETVVKKGEVVGQVDDGLGGTVPVVAAKDLTVPVWSGASVALKLTDDGKPLPHSANAGTEVGMLTVGSGAGEAKVPVTLKDDLSEPSFGAKLTRLG
ncbi:D-alanyl-D-alanine carboxypeptidase [Streptomyces violascens]|uniref:serine-type D-Ala-D-Ala carboxypeptidase n=1 Tax=Streptomyces violascens TaxID=67381 RepID=A0ABQ3QFN9_9ACTN|nr:D-alanyl-D-alanine carboxypeptidase [Streptomyces violascens]GGT87459.1 D-alanyl-D-alanine carboxypeptidase [Streptomyces violascens]GHI36090.1 D-alanyl-D-alanine carboxypeptidase [Streptomyces violascens]